MTNCQQKKCIFNQIEGCPFCLECQSEPNKVEENCVSCHNCQYDEGFIRGSRRKEELPNVEIKVFQ